MMDTQTAPAQRFQRIFGVSAQLCLSLLWPFLVTAQLVLRHNSLADFVGDMSKTLCYGTLAAVLAASLIGILATRVHSVGRDIQSASWRVYATLAVTGVLLALALAFDHLKL